MAGKRRKPHKPDRWFQSRVAEICLREAGERQVDIAQANDFLARLGDWAVDGNMTDYIGFSARLIAKAEERQVRRAKATCR